MQLLRLWAFWTLTEDSGSNYSLRFCWTVGYLAAEQENQSGLWAMRGTWVIYTVPTRWMVQRVDYGKSWVVRRVDYENFNCIKLQWCSLFLPVRLCQVMSWGYWLEAQESDEPWDHHLPRSFRPLRAKHPPQESLFLTQLGRKLYCHLNIREHRYCISRQICARNKSRICLRRIYKTMKKCWIDRKMWELLPVTNTASKQLLVEGLSLRC